MPFIAAGDGCSRARFASDLVLADGWGFAYDLLPIDLEDDRVPLPEGVELQTRKILANLETLLKHAGLGRENVVAVRIHLVEFGRLYERMNAAYAGFFPAGRGPTRSCIGVSALTRGAQVAMDVVLSADPP